MENKELIEKKEELYSPSEKRNLVKIKKLLGTLGFPNLTNDEVFAFAAKCKASGLNPFAGDVSVVPFVRGDGTRTIAAITYYQIYLARAQESDKFYRWEKTYTGEGENRKIILKVFDINDKLMDVRELVAKNWAGKSSKTGRMNAMWASKTDFMLEKVALAQSARLVCAKECKNLPYTIEEATMIPGYQIKANSEPKNTLNEPKNIKVGK